MGERSDLSDRSVLRYRTHLRRLSALSKHHRYHHAAIIAKGNTIFAAAVNNGHHAEANAIHRAGSCKGATMYTLMTRLDGSIGNGSPCSRCLAAIQQAKIKRVIVYVG